jgi:hypothetical protein
VAVAADVPQMSLMNFSRSAASWQGDDLRGTGRYQCHLRGSASKLTHYHRRDPSAETHRRSAPARRPGQIAGSDQTDAETAIAGAGSAERLTTVPISPLGQVGPPTPAAESA